MGNILNVGCVCIVTCLVCKMVVISNVLCVRCCWKQEMAAIGDGESLCVCVVFVLPSVESDKGFREEIRKPFELILHIQTHEPNPQ